VHFWAPPAALLLAGWLICVTAVAFEAMAEEAIIVARRDRDRAKLLTSYGYTFVRTGKHEVWRHPQLGLLSMAQTPSDRHALSQIERDIQRKQVGIYSTGRGAR
jgi:isocitrate lyase